MNEILTCGPGIWVFLSMAVAGVVLIIISFLTREQNK